MIITLETIWLTIYDNYLGNHMVDHIIITLETIWLTIYDNYLGNHMVDHI